VPKKLKLHLFEGYGIELEYIIVHNDDLSILPVADRVLHAVSGTYEPEVELGDLNWSNELVLHVVELKTNGPASSLEDLPQKFNRDIGKINQILKPMGGRLMPTAMHPWMDPLKETKLWPHEYNPIYESYNRIFSCQGHGWSNLQSLHINLPFANDEEFGRLHAAIRLVLPIIPAIAASSPIVDGKVTGIMDNRLEAYRNNQNKIPSLVGKVIPEPLYTKKDYRKKLLQKLYQDIDPYDTEDILKQEWLNSRGAIARFDRNTIEIRVIDIQECPFADLAITAAIVGLIRMFVSEHWISFNRQQDFPMEPLADILLANIKDAETAIITDQYYLEMFDFNSNSKCKAGELWQFIFEKYLSKSIDEVWLAPLQIILQKGTLSRRILAALGNDRSLENIRDVFLKLMDCLEKEEMFRT